jgi:hypothetical protein
MLKLPCLFGSEPEHEIRGKFVCVAFDSLVESFGRQPIDSRQVRIEHYFLSTNFVNECLKLWHASSDRFIQHGKLMLEIIERSFRSQFATLETSVINENRGS